MASFLDMSDHRWPNSSCLGHKLIEGQSTHPSSYRDGSSFRWSPITRVGVAHLSLSRRHQIRIQPELLPQHVVAMLLNIDQDIALNS